MARALSSSGEDYLRSYLPPDQADQLIREIGVWEPKPPQHAVGKLARVTARGRAYLCTCLGDAEGNRVADNMDGWAEERERTRAHRTTLWTPERMKSTDRSNAERQRRYRERKRIARKRLDAPAE